MEEQDKNKKKEGYKVKDSNIRKLELFLKKLNTDNDDDSN